MQYTSHYNLKKAEGSDTVNMLTDCYPNFDTIDAAMFENKESSIGTATEVVTGTSHAIVRSNTDSDVFRFTATGAWTAGDTMSIDGNNVTVHLSDGTTPPTGAYIIGAEVIAVLNGTLVTLFTSSKFNGVESFNSRSGAVVPESGDYSATEVSFDNIPGMTAATVQEAIGKLVENTRNYVVSYATGDGDKTVAQILNELWTAAVTAGINSLPPYLMSRIKILTGNTVYSVMVALSGDIRLISIETTNNLFGMHEIYWGPNTIIRNVWFDGSGTIHYENISNQLSVNGREYAVVMA